MRFEISGGKIALFVQLAGVSDPFVNQNQAGRIHVEQFPQRVAGIRGAFVIEPDALVGVASAKLPRQFAPERPRDRAVGLDARIAGRNLIPHQHHAPHLWQRRLPAVLQQFVHSVQAAEADAGKEVIERQHGMGFAAAEIGLQLNHRLAAVAGHALNRVIQDMRQAVG